MDDLFVDSDGSRDSIEDADFTDTIIHEAQIAILQRLATLRHELFETQGVEAAALQPRAEVLIVSHNSATEEGWGTSENINLSQYFAVIYFTVLQNPWCRVYA